MKMELSKSGMRSRSCWLFQNLTSWPPDPYFMGGMKFSNGNIDLAHFWYTHFWVPGPIEILPPWHKSLGLVSHIEVANWYLSDVAKKAWG